MAGRQAGYIAGLCSRSKGVALGACAVFAIVLAGCGADSLNGVVAYPDGYDWGDSGNVAGVDGASNSDATTADGASVDPDANAAPTGDAGSAYNLRFAMPNANKDDFGGVCNQVCALQIHQNGLRNVYIGLFKGDEPVPNDEVRFELANPADKALGEVLVEHALTDEKGVAGSQIKTVGQLGTFEVVVSAPGHTEAKPIAFQVHVISKIKGPLKLTMNYLGTENPLLFAHNKFRLSLQAQGHPKCADIDLGEAQLPKAAWESPPNMQFGKPWVITYPSFASWVQKQQGLAGGAPLQFTVIALAAKSAVTPAMAGGCVDTGATVTWNPQTKALEGDDVVVTVVDIPPRLKGVYEMTTYLDLLSILPDPIELVFKTIFDIMTDPIAGTLALACKLGGSSLDSFCGFIFTDPKKPDIKNLQQPFGEIVVKLLNAALLAALPTEVKTGLATGADLGAILTNLELGGFITIDKEPDAKGFLSKDFTKDEITSITYKWSLGQGCNPKDPNCGKKTFSISAFQQNAIVGHFDLWRNPVLSQVKFSKHGLNIKWGALVNYILQKQLLPLITNPKNDPTQPVVDSWEKLIKSLLTDKKCLFKDTCCEDFAKNIANSQSIIKAPFLTGVCEALIKLGAGFLDSQMAKLDVDTSKGGGLTLYTEKCPLLEFDGDQYIDAIGSKVELCNWNMTLMIGGSPQKIDAKFYSLRQN
jgi:hypothetical protein